jgi:hypothetical protein
MLDTQQDIRNMHGIRDTALSPNDSFVLSLHCGLKEKEESSNWIARTPGLAKSTSVS